MAIRPLDDRVVVDHLKQKKRHKAELFYRTQQKKNQQKVRLYLLVMGNSWTAVKEPNF